MRNDLNQYGYVKLSSEQTKDFINSNVALLDDVMQTEDNDFTVFAANNYDWLMESPYDVFEKFFDSLDKLDTLDKYQKGFVDYARVNILLPLKWYTKNGRAVNLSEKQAGWFRKWFTKHGIDASCVPSVEKQNIVKPKLEL